MERLRASLARIFEFDRLSENATDGTIIVVTKGQAVTGADGGHAMIGHYNYI